MRVASALIRGLVGVVRLLAFWSAIVLPVALVSLLFVDPGRIDGVDIALLLGINVASVVLGSGYSGSTLRRLARIGERAR